MQTDQTLDPVALARVRDLVHSGANRAIRRAARVSQSEVAAHCGVTVGAVSRWESTGKHKRIPRGLPAVLYLELLERLMAR
jgi:DNA-binding transcriptional regulator YiaG